MRNRIGEFIKDRKNQSRYASWLMYQIRPILGAVLCLVLLRSLIAVIGVSKAVIEKYIVDQAAQTLGIKQGIILAVGIMFLSLGLSAISSIYVNTFQERFSFRTRCDMYEKMLKASWQQLQQYHSGDMLTRLTSDVNTVTGGIVNILVTSASLTVQLVTAFLLLVHYDWHLALFIIILSPAAALAGLFFTIQLRGIQVKYQEAESKYRVYLQEHISHITVIKAFTGEAASVRGLEKLRDERLHWVKKKNYYTVLANICISAAFSVGYLVAFITGAMQISRGEITYGTMTAFLSLVGQIQAPMYSMAQTLPQIVSVLASAGRVMEVGELKSEDGHDKGFADTIKGGAQIGIMAQDISFSYSGERTVFRKFCMDIRPGSISVMMGHSGVGKTTIIRMLLGFVQPDEGDLFFYSRQQNMVKPSAGTRKLLSYVPQGNTLFQGTIAENLRLGKAEATEAEMKQSLEMACAWKFVSGLPKGLGTMLGEKAGGISEGQAQRIAIARAFLRECSLLILDEATSALDENTEKMILKNLWQKKERPTCFIVTHRSLAKKYADQILVIEEGTLE